MKLSDWRNTHLRLAVVYVLAICFISVVSLSVQRPKPWAVATDGQAVQGQTAAQPEGTVLNLVNWVGKCDLSCRSGAGGVMAVVSYSQDAVSRDGR